MARGFFAVPDGHRDVALGGHHVAPRKNTGVAGHHVGIDLHHAICHAQAWHAVDERQVHILPQRQHHRISLQRFKLAGGLREAFFIQRHFFDGDARLARLADGGQPLDQHAFLQRLFHFKRVCRHFVAAAAVDDDGLGGPQALGRARHVDGGVAAAIHHHFAPEHGLVFALHAAQHRHGVEHPGRIACRDVRPLGNVRTHGQKHRVEPALLPRVEHAGDFGVVFDAHTQVDNALHLGIQHVAGQAVLGNAKPHHAAGQRPGFAHRYLMAQPRQMVRCGQARRPRTHHQHPFASRRCGRRQGPAFGDGLVTQKTLDRVDAHRLVQLGAVARAFAGVVAHATHDGGKGVVLHQLLPGGFVVARFGMEQPALDVLACWALVVAGGHAVQVHRAGVAPRACVVGQRTAHIQGDGKGFLHGCSC